MLSKPPVPFAGRILRRAALGTACALSLLAAVAALAAPTVKKSGAGSRPASAAPPTKTAGAPPYQRPVLAPGDTLLLKVGDRTMSFAQFRGEWARTLPNQRPQVADPLVAYKIFLSDLISRELMGAEAMRHPHPLTAVEQASLDSLWHQQARNQLFLEDVEGRVQVDTTQIERYRTELSRILFLEAYVFPTREAAQAWYTRIVGGVPVSRLEAVAKSDAPGAPKYIDMGHKIREDFDEETARIVFALAPGRLSTPVQAAEGWALIRLTGTRMRANGAVLTNQGTIKEVRRLKASSYKEAYRDSMAKALHVVYHEAAIDTLLNRFLLLRNRTEPRDEGGNTYHMFQPMPTYLPGDAERVLATSDLGQVTGADLYAHFLGLGEIQRPEVRTSEQLAKWVDRVAFDQALLRRAVERGYDKSPRVLAEVSRLREYYYVSHLYADSISAQVHPSESELAAYYAADSARWKQQETVTLWVCGLPSRAQADSVLQAVRAGANIKETAYRLTTLGQYAESGGMIEPFARNQAPLPAVEDSAFRTPEGAFGGPVASPEGWIIYKVIHRVPERMRPYEEVKADVAQQYRNEQEEQLMQLFLSRLRKRIPVEIHEEWLATLVAPPKS